MSAGSPPAPLRRPYVERCIGLAGALQSASLVKTICEQGPQITDTELSAAMIASLNSVLVLTPATAEEVYDSDLSGLQVGLKLLQKVIGREWGDHLETLDLLYQMVRVQRLLQSNKSLQRILRKRLEKVPDIVGSAEHLESFCVEVSDIYRDTLSQLNLRIPLRPARQFQQDPRMLLRLRPLLMAGIRAITLWRQCGGKIWLMLFERRILVETAGHLLDTSR